ncbi:MAG: hypothetical protein R3B55_03810 [Candidatus Paceibacterota bacterium]
MKKKVSKNKVGKAVLYQIAAAVVAGAAAYALVGPNGKKNRAKVKCVEKIKNKVTENKEVKKVTGEIKKVVAKLKKMLKRSEKSEVSCKQSSF